MLENLFGMRDLLGWALAPGPIPTYTARRLSLVKPVYRRRYGERGSHDTQILAIAVATAKRARRLARNRAVIATQP